MRYLFYLFIIGVVILAWCPWLKADEVMNIIDAKVAEIQESTPDLCAVFVNRDSISKVPFGYTEEVSYDCTITDPENGVLKSYNSVFVTFYKGILNMPKKTINSGA